MCFLLSSLISSSSVSVVFDFNASLNDVAPLSPMLLTGEITKKNEKSELLMDVICLSFAFTTQSEFIECCV